MLETYIARGLLAVERVLPATMTCLIGWPVSAHNLALDSLKSMRHPFLLALSLARH